MQIQNYVMRQENFTSTTLNQRYSLDPLTNLKTQLPLLGPSPTSSAEAPGTGRRRILHARQVRGAGHEPSFSVCHGPRDVA